MWEGGGGRGEVGLPYNGGARRTCFGFHIWRQLPGTPKKYDRGYMAISYTGNSQLVSKKSVHKSMCCIRIGTSLG